MSPEHTPTPDKERNQADQIERSGRYGFAEEKHVRILDPNNKDDQRLLDRKSDEFFMSHAPESFSDEIANDIRSLQ